ARDRVYHAACRRSAEPLRHGRADGYRHREVPHASRRSVSRDRLGRRLQELVHERSANARALAVPADRTQPVLRTNADRRFRVHTYGSGRLTLPIRRTRHIAWHTVPAGIKALKLTPGPHGGLRA